MFQQHSHKTNFISKDRDKNKLWYVAGSLLSLFPTPLNKNEASLAHLVIWKIVLMEIRGISSGIW